MNRGVYGVTVSLLTVLFAMALAPSAGAQVTREGVLRETVSENFERGESVTTYSLHADGETTPIVPTAPVSAASGDRVEVSGAMHEGTLVGPVTQAAGAAAGPGGPIFIGPRRVLVLHARFAGDPAEPWSPELTREKIFTGAESADVYFQEESRGVIALAGKDGPDGDVSPWLTLSSSGSGCSQNAWGNEALQRAGEAGISLTGYNHYVFVFTKRFGCFWNGMATGAGNSGTIYINGNQDVQTIAHEFGHNFGLQHAGSWTCTRNGIRVQVSSSCSAQEYGDPFDAMGNQWARHNSGWNLAKLGMLNEPNVTTATENGTYTLRAALSVSPAPTILRIPRTKDAGGNVTSWYYLEIRQQGGIFENLSDATMTGVSIRAIASGSSPETLLIDSTPATSTFLDAPLHVGATFTDPTVRVTTLSAGAGAASVSVEFGDWIDSEAPTAPTGVSAAQSAADVNLQWNASADNVGVTRYIVHRNGSLIGASSTTSFTDKGSPVGLNAYTVYAEDAAGNRSPGSASKVVTVVRAEDEAGGRSPGSTPGVGSTVTRGATGDQAGRQNGRASRIKPALRWERRSSGRLTFEVDARRNPRVSRVSLWLNGRLLRSKKGRVLRLTWKPPSARCVRGAYRFSARAYAPAGNGRFAMTARNRFIRHSGACPLMRE
jgi:hypothetical protein